MTVLKFHPLADIYSMDSDLAVHGSRAREPKWSRAIKGGDSLHCSRLAEFLNLRFLRHGTVHSPLKTISPFLR